MVKSTLLLAFIFGYVTSFGQNLSITFSGIGAAIKVDSVTATNLNTHNSITLPGNDTLLLAIKTGVPIMDDFDNTGTVFPNPFFGRATFVKVVEGPQICFVAVRNLFGQIVAQSEEILQAGRNNFVLSLSTAGIYIVTLETQDGTSGYKVICTDSNCKENSIILGGVESNESGRTGTSDVKMSQTKYLLGFADGDSILFNCKSGVFKTIFTYSPSSSINLPVEFIPCTDPDGKNYPIVVIGEQIWMAENLAYLPRVYKQSRGSNSFPYFYVSGYDPYTPRITAAKNVPNYRTYGVLYNWIAAMDGASGSVKVPSGVRGICPEGWHLPSLAEWGMLKEYLGPNSGEKLKSTSGWLVNGNGDNSSGFNALPSGTRHFDGGFFELGNSAYYWTSSILTSYTTWSGQLRGESDVTEQFDGMYRRGFSVRCLLGEAGPFTGPTASFSISPPFGNLSTDFQFDASASIDNETPKSGLEVRWDWDEDGRWDTQYDKTKLASHNFSGHGSSKTTYSVLLEVKDADGNVNTAIKKVIVGDVFTDNRDNHIYKYNVIGSQVWMTENLAYLPIVSSGRESSDLSQHYYVADYFGNVVDEAVAHPNYEIYGVLYNWEAAKNACPAGWHLPSDEEWKVLERTMGVDYFEIDAEGWRKVRDWGLGGNCFKAWQGWNSYEGHDCGYGFNALPGGYRVDSEYNFQEMSYYAFFWTSTLHVSGGAFYRGLKNDEDGVYRNFDCPKNEGFSIRCMKD
jgi:uncharacterized protein (TIGR02145 family)